MKPVSYIEIKLDQINDSLVLWINERTPNTLFDGEEDATLNNEARYQIIEGFDYDFEFNDPNFSLGDIGENIVRRHKRTDRVGTISPNIFVGTLSIPIIENGSVKENDKIELEVQSIKTGYRDDYRNMLELITEKSTDLLLQINSPVSQHFEKDYTKDSETLYQKFVFINSVLCTDEFTEAIHRITISPSTRWTEITEEKDVRNIRRYSNSNIKEIIKGSKRTKLQEVHYLNRYGIDTIPERISTSQKTDSVDTPENRFIKHALETFLKFCSDINIRAKEYKHAKMVNESENLVRILESQLHHSFFRSISRPTILNLNSPVLQRKEGYREVLRIWLMFDLAAKLIWTGGDDIYNGGKKDIATLYEYWLFFTLLDLFKSIFEIEPKEINKLITETPDGMNLVIKQGVYTALKGIYNSGNRKLNIRFNYNRSFRGEKTYPESGSWTTTLRPDYTLSIWPLGITEHEAEKQELIVHVHFDAKYKIANFIDYLEKNDDPELDKEKIENRKGIYKNADLLKMHAYKDAIRRTGGAYVLYPGDILIKRKGFHEIIPGLGAFPVKPSKTDSGIGVLKVFILEIVEHFLNRTSQREKIAFRTYDIFKNPPETENIVNDRLPEPYNDNRDLIPDDTFVLVGYYKSEAHLEWIKKTNLYNFRMSSGTGSLILDKETVSSKYLLLHTKGDTEAYQFFKIKSKGPKVYSKQDLINKNYPTPKHENYLVIEIEPISDIEFQNMSWNFKNLKSYNTDRASALPFTTNLTELMRNKARN